MSFLRLIKAGGSVMTKDSNLADQASRLGVAYAPARWRLRRAAGTSPAAGDLHVIA